MSHFRRRAELFLIQPFRWFIFSGFVATFGSGLSYIAMTWLLLQTDNSISAIAVLMTCFWMPTVILAPWAGVIADKYPRKMIVIFSTFIRGTILIIFATAYSTHLSSLSIYILTTLMGILLSIYIPASTALVREIVPKNDLLYANSTFDMVYELGYMTGIGSAGFVIFHYSPQLAILLNGIFFIIAALLLLLMKAVTRYQNFHLSQISFFEAFIKGLRYLYSNKAITIIYTIQLLVLVIFMTTPILLAPFAKNVLHVNVIQFGKIEAALSIGLITGGFFLPYFAEKIGIHYAVIVSCVTAGISFIIFSLTRNIPIAEALNFIIGFCLSVWAVIITQAQHLTENKFQGRVQATFNSLSGICILAIYFAMYYLGNLIPIAYFYHLQCFVMLVAAILTWQYRDKIGIMQKEKANSV